MLKPARAYRWGEDGIAGISDNHHGFFLCDRALNGEDAI